jgi:hypothetical protein
MDFKYENFIEIILIRVRNFWYFLIYRPHKKKTLELQNKTGFQNLLMEIPDK